MIVPRALVCFLALSMTSLVAIADSPASDPKIIQLVGNNQTDQLTKFLKNKKNDVNIKDKEGNTALFYSIGAGSLESTRLLLKAGARVDELYGDDKETLLFECVRFENAEAAKLILEKQPSLADVKNAKGKSVMDYAKAMKADKIVAVLSQKEKK